MIGKGYLNLVKGTLTTEVLQGSISEPLSFNILLNPLFLFVLNLSLCNYADDNMLKKKKRTSTLSSDIVSQIFYKNYLLHAGKCHLKSWEQYKKQTVFLQ